MKVNFVKCGECGMLMQAPWMVGGWLLVLDSMLEPYKDQSKRPFMATHIADNPEFDNICPKCKHDFKDDKKQSACLVNHGDNSACIHCPKCSTYIRNSAVWHKTDWIEEDLILEDWDPPWDTSYEKKFHFTYEELKTKLKPKGEIKDLK